ncbi:hypothetical protein, partial [uncultured Parabacteroides sp.]|uniref:hypothetical protein n=1 Tax=uncultured Parabacteroides sp. TaxID=512312 RepID=UPI00259AEDA5
SMVLRKSGRVDSRRFIQARAERQKEFIRKSGLLFLLNIAWWCAKTPFCHGGLDPPSPKHWLSV